MSSQEEKNKEQLMIQLMDLDPKKRQLAVLELLKLGDKRWLMTVSGNDDDFDNLRRVDEPIIQKTLAEYSKNEKKIKKLINQLVNENPQKRIKAANQLYELRQGKFRQYIKGDDDDLYRICSTNDIAIAEALGRSKNPKTVAVLSHIIDHEYSVFMRTAAVRAFRYKPRNEENRMILKRSTDHYLMGGSYAVTGEAKEVLREYYKDKSYR